MIRLGPIDGIALLQSLCQRVQRDANEPLSAPDNETTETKITMSD